MTVLSNTRVSIEPFFPFFFFYKMIDLIDCCLMQALAVFQVYRGMNIFLFINLDRKVKYSNEYVIVGRYM